MPGETLSITRLEVAGIMLGTAFLLMGLAAAGFSAARGGGGKFRLLLWQGIFSALFGARVLAAVPASFSILPQWMWPSRSFVLEIITYLIIIPAALFWMELSAGFLRRLLKIALMAASLLGVVGIIASFILQSPEKLVPAANLLAVVLLLALTPLVVIPGLARKNLIVQSPVAAAGTLIAAVASLYAAVQTFVHVPELAFLEPAGVALFVLALGYVAAEKVLSDEHRPFSVEDELAVAREIHNSILPEEVPELYGVKVSATHHPTPKLAGDFYEFLAVDSKHAGFLVADVSGHGVPAALIAAMVKVAAQKVTPQAADPREVLRGLNRTLTRQLRGKFVSLAYLWVDVETGTAKYSGAGHPPLIRWRGGKLERFESNGLLMGVMANADYPVRELELRPGDRFLLYTDGLIEPENAEGHPFGESRLEHVLRNDQGRPPDVLAQDLLWEINRWQPAFVTQEDDITMIVIDAVGGGAA